MSPGATVLPFEVLIWPQRAAGQSTVRIWAGDFGGEWKPLFVGPEGAWIEYSRRLEMAKLMDARALGTVDACLSRGEVVRRSLHCRVADLLALGLRQTDVPVPQNVLKGQMTTPKPTREVLHPRFRLEVDETFHSPSVLPSEEGTSDTPVTIDPPSLDGKQGITPLSSLAGDEISQLPARRLAILGVRIDDLSMDETIEVLDDFVEKGGFHQVATANVDFLTKAMGDPSLRAILHTCDLVLADGMPLVWSSRLMGAPLRQRVTGADLLPRLFELSAKKKRRIFLLGASEEGSRVAVQRLMERYPESIVCGRMSPPFASLSDMDHKGILDAIHDTKPDILLVAFGNPKQEKWLHMHRDRLAVPVCIGVGASIDFISGEQARAPGWMQRLGLEWTHRLANDPRRLAIRYLDNGICVLRHLSKQLLAHSLQPRRTSESHLTLLRDVDTITVNIVGSFSGEVVSALVERVSDLSSQPSLILDLTSSVSVGLDAAGAIAYLAHKRSGGTGALWIVGENPHLRRVLDASFPSGLPFRRASSVQHALQLGHT